MHKWQIYIILLIFTLTTIGCSSNISEITAPPDNMSLDEVTKINLKTLDLNKLSKTDIYEIDGIKLNKNASGYELDYRFPNKPIKVKIIKFANKETLTTFWKNWLTVHNLAEKSKANTVEFTINNFNSDSYSIYAWQKGPWFTYIGVPMETPQSEPLRNKVKDLISNHYLNLAKREVNQIK